MQIYYYTIRNKEEEMNIRLEQPEDYREVENLTREAFWNVYRPGCVEHFVLHRLRSDPDLVPELDIVMEKSGRLIGQNVFMRAHIAADDGDMSVAQANETFQSPSGGQPVV